MTGALFHLGRFCVRRRWIVLAVWLLVFAVLAIWGRALGPNVNDNLTLPGTDSHAATDLLEQRFPSQANGTNPVMLRAPQGEKISAAKYKQPIDDTVSALKKDPAIRSAKSPLSSKESDLLSKDQTIGYIALNLRPSPSELTAGYGEPDRRAGGPGAQGGPRGRFRWLPGPEGLQARDALERGDRARDGGDRAAGHVRHGGRDGAADLHGDRRARLRALDHHADQPRR